MDTKKKILILYASAGHGHEKAARAIGEVLSDKKDSAAVTLIDTLTLTRGSFGDRYKNGYIYMIQRFPSLWGFFYYLTDIAAVYFLIRPFRRLVNAFEAAPLHKKILDEAPDIVISTHFMATEVVSHLKQKGRTSTVLINVVTDYLAHAFWLAPGVDRYAVGSSETVADLRRRGIPAQKIVSTGIPIEKKFSQTQDRASLRDRFGVPQDAFAVLVTSGGAGVGSLLSLIDEILKVPRGIHVFAVCGTNEKLLVSMKGLAEKNPRLHPFGFVNNIQELMSASDVVVGKGGGLTVSESLSMGRPLILYGSVPGQETRNVQCMTKHGVALPAFSYADVLRFLTDFVDQPDLLRRYTENALRIGRPKAAQEIVDLAYSIVDEQS